MLIGILLDQPEHRDLTMGLVAIAPEAARAPLRSSNVCERARSALRRQRVSVRHPFYRGWPGGLVSGQPITPGVVEKDRGEDLPARS
jgi:hypothetical protein